MNARTRFLVLALVWSGIASAGGTRYELRVDGLACPYCAYGIEKKLKRAAGVETVDIDLDRGVVIVTTGEGARLTRKQLDRIVKDAGFTLRGVEERPR